MFGKEPDLDRHDRDLEPLMYFEFVNHEQKTVPLCFVKPKAILTATSVEEVVPALQQVQHAVDNGSYAAGYIAYEAAPAFDPSLNVVHSRSMPLLWFGIYDKPNTSPIEQSNGRFSITDWERDITMEAYQQNFLNIQSCIEKGDTRQVNYTFRLRAQFAGDDLAFFHKLKENQASHYACYLRLGAYRIVSASPELFFHVKQDRITMRPMKGTVERGRWYEEDVQNLNWLATSEKNQSENRIIVDLLKHDLAKIAKGGTVHVPRMFEIEKYPTVYQMTSTLTADLLRHTPITNILRALFPSGSITGAPKAGTMRMIAELEKEPRGVYCGAIGYLTPEGEAIFNVPIRTTLIHQPSGTAEYGIGGGITRRSSYEGEYDEALAKAKILTQPAPDFKLLESIRLENGQYFILEEHIDRLMHSATYWDIHADRTAIETALQDYAVKLQHGMFKVRLLVSKQGEIAVEGQEIFPQYGPSLVVLATSPVSKENVFLYHKTTYRAVYNVFKSEFPHVYDILLWNEERELTEFTTGNVVLELDGKRYTPPVQSGLLPGTYRRHLLKTKQLFEKTLVLEDLDRCTAIWLINSVRKWVRVTLGQGVGERQ